MSFQSPLLLAALVLVPLLTVAYLRLHRTRTRAMAAFASPAVLASALPSRPGWRRHLPIALYLLALTGLIAALARPQATIAAPAERASIVLATDISGSMQATDVAPNRLDAARDAAKRFLADAPDDVRVGALAFNQAPQALASPSTDRAPLEAALDGLEPSGSTATGEALDAALRMARPAAQEGEQPPPAAIILLSDGESVRGQDPVAVAQRARDAGVPVYTVALGTAGGTIPTPDGGAEPVPPDTATLERIAQTSGGEAFTALDADQLGAVYDRLGSQIVTEPQQLEITGAFAAGAVAALVLGAGLSLLWFRRVP